MKTLMICLFMVMLALCGASLAWSDADKGQGVYMNFCASCHNSGIAGAPKIGDKADWEQRMEKGMDAVVTNAIKGYKGSKGYMPAKGGNSALTDEEVSDAVMYMVKQSE